MKKLLSHFDATPKSVGAAVVAFLGMLAAFRFLSMAQAEAGGAFALAFLALLKPARKRK